MSEPAGRLPLRGSLKDRRREVRDCLADCGFGTRPFRLRRGPAPEASRPTYGRRLRAALTKLGPVFASFGAYLASRADLPGSLPRDELALLTPQPPALPAASVRALLTKELGRTPAEVYATFEERPCEVGLLFQSHCASLRRGEPVTVKIVDPGREERLAADLASLALLEHALGGEAELGTRLEGVIADFRHTVHQQSDLRHEAKVMEALGQDAEECNLLFAPRVHGELSTARVLTLGRPPGRGLGEMLRRVGGAARGQGASAQENPSAGFDPLDVASRLCTVWLRQALLGRFFPVEVGGDNVTLLPDGRLAFTGVCSSVPLAGKTHLWEYLLAASADDPDRACTHLFSLLEKDQRVVAEDDLRHRFRQAVLFRDGDRRRTDGGESLGELLRVHRRFAEAAGCRAPVYLSRWYRALFLVQEAALPLAPGKDSLRGGLENVRVMAALGNFRELLSLAQWNYNLEQYAPVLLDLPNKVDEVLSLLAGGAARMQLQWREAESNRRHRNARARAVALLLALAGAALLGYHLDPGGSLAGWGVRTATVVFLFAGVFLMGAFNRTR
jgi:predicted unusual protein kinase regulating ubiquinone biosynthesis (AarF/ABC1/UbiB family)